MYTRETGDWQTQSIAQDLFDLFFAVPALLITAILFRKGSRIAFFILAGILAFLIYTFIIYTFGVHFNRLFILYCFTLGLSSYIFIYLLWNAGSEKIRSWFDDKHSVTGSIIYLLFFTLLFSFFWLKEIIPAIANGAIPVNLLQSGLLTNPVHVIDLSFVLPGFAITAFLLKRRHPLGFVFTPIIMTFSVIMTLSIAALLFYEYSKGFIADYSVAIGMIFFSIVSIFMFWRFVKNFRTM